MMRGTLLIALAFLTNGSSAHAADQPVMLTPLTAVCEKQRSEKEDVVYLGDKGVLRGSVLNETLRIGTPYGDVSLQLRRCAALLFEGLHDNTEGIVTVNRNWLTGVVTDRTIRFRIGSSGEEIDIHKEGIRLVVLRRLASELDFVDPAKPLALFVMANGDLLTGWPVEDTVSVTTDSGSLSVPLSEIRKIEMQGGDSSSCSSLPADSR